MCSVTDLLNPDPDNGGPSDLFTRARARYLVTDLERYLLNQAGPAVRAAGYMTLPQFLLTVLWKGAQQAGQAREVDEEIVQLVTRRALAEGRPLNERILALSDEYYALGGRGVRVRTAAAILCVWEPGDFTMYDINARTTVRNYREAGGIFGEGIGEGYQPPALPENPDNEEWTPEDYEEYNNASVLHAQRLGVTLRDLDRVLWRCEYERRRSVSGQA